MSQDYENDIILSTEVIGCLKRRNKVVLKCDDTYINSKDTKLIDMLVNYFTELRDKCIKHDRCIDNYYSNFLFK